MKKILFIFAIGIGIFTACKKGELVENTKYEKLEPGSTKFAYLKLLNASPGSPVVNFYINGTKFSSVYTSSGKENGGFGYNGLFPDLGYAYTTPKSQTLSAKILDNASINPGLEVFNNSIVPEGGKYYSIITNGLYNTTTKQIPNYTVIEDVRPATDTTKVFVRLINMYSGGPSVDMIDLTTGQTLAKAVPTGTASSWFIIPNPGQSNKYAFKNSTTSVAYSVSLIATLTKGRAYTVYTRGVAGNTTYPFDLGFYTTFY
nr:DUF4397 domain-containing protein [Pseudopedobacter sp.]